MKKLLLASAIWLMAGCGNDAKDGDAQTDTTNFNTERTTPSAAPYGDTTLNMSPPDTTAQP